MLVYWSLGSVYTLLDLTNWPQFVRKYKVQPGTNEPVEGNKLIKVSFKYTILSSALINYYLQGILTGIFNQIVVGIPVSYLAFSVMKWRGMPPARELPTFHRVLFELPLFILIEEFGFYYSHRWEHSIGGENQKLNIIRK